MKTKLVLAMCTAFPASDAAMAAQTADQSVQTTKTVTATVRHLNGANSTWCKDGGVVPVQYRGNNLCRSALANRAFQRAHGTIARGLR